MNTKPNKKKERRKICTIKKRKRNKKKISRRKKKENGKYIKTHKIINENTKLQFNGAQADGCTIYIHMCVLIVKLPFHNSITHTDEWVMSNVGKVGWLNSVRVSMDK